MAKCRVLRISPVREATLYSLPCMLIRPLSSPLLRFPLSYLPRHMHHLNEFCKSSLPPLPRARLLYIHVAQGHARAHGEGRAPHSRPPPEFCGMPTTCRNPQCKPFWASRIVCPGRGEEEGEWNFLLFWEAVRGRGVLSAGKGKGDRHGE